MTMPFAHALTIAEIQRFIDELDQQEQDVDDVEIVIIPPDVDEVTDEEDIQENELIGNEVGDVAGTLELFLMEP